MRKNTQYHLSFSCALFLADRSPKPAPDCSLSSVIGSGVLKDVDLRRDGPEAGTKLLNILSGLPVYLSTCSRDGRGYLTFCPCRDLLLQLATHWQTAFSLEIHNEPPRVARIIVHA